MKKLVLIMLIAILFLSVTTIATNRPTAHAFEMPKECSIALWNPTALATCIAMIAFELWDPLDWGD